MKKLIMILAMVCMLGSIALGVMNRDFLKKTLDNLKQAEQDVREVTTELGKREDERDGLRDDEDKARDVKNMASAALDASLQTQVIEQRKVDGLKTRDTEIDLQQKELDLIVRMVFPDGIVKTPDELRMNLTMLEDELSTNRSRIDDIKNQILALQAAQQVQVKRVSDEEEFQLDRKQKLALGALEATVIAVNPEWGFIMVNAGKIHGVESDASLLVKRGNTRIARLRIVTLQENVTVCELVEGSAVKGLSVGAGDKVIFENPFR